MSGFEPVDETVIHEGPVVRLVSGRFRAPDGSIVHREIARHPGAVGVVPVVDDHIVLVRQYRAAIDVDLLEIPAGKLDVAGEDLADAARRELREEVGLAAGSLELLVSYYNTPGFCDEFSHVYLARECTAVPDDRQGIEEETMVIEHLPVAEIRGAIAAGRVRDGKTLIGLLTALPYLEA